MYVSQHLRGPVIAPFYRLQKRLGMLNDPIKWEGLGSQSPDFSAPDLLLLLLFSYILKAFHLDFCAVIVSWTTHKEGRV